MTAASFSVRWNGTVRHGPAVDLDADADPEAVGKGIAGDGPVEVRCRLPGPVHDHVGVIDPSRSISVRGALAAAARSRGLTAPMDEDIADLDRRLGAIDTTGDPRTAISDAQRRVAERRERERTLRERVQTLHGRLRGLRERDEPTGDTEAALAAATEALADVETERIAAEEELQRHRQTARDHRDRQERRLRLQDERDNLARAARQSLAETVFDEFADAVEVVPGEGRAGKSPGRYEGDSTTAALAVARVADVRAPIAVACGRFSDAVAAAECLQAPVIRIPPDRPADVTKGRPAVRSR